MKESAALRFAGLLFLFGLTLPARADLTIEITGAGEHQIPIAVVPFAGEEKLTQGISSVVAADLQRSGLFRLVNTDRQDAAPSQRGGVRQLGRHRRAGDRQLRPAGKRPRHGAIPPDGRGAARPS